MKNCFLLFFLVSTLISCKKNTKTTIDKNVSSFDSISTAANEEGLKLMQTYCYACHNPKAKSHDEIIAPPFVAVKRRYQMQYDKEAFIKAVVAWVNNPTTEEALMRGAVDQFKVMPKLPLNESDLIKIASYMYDNDLEAPAWFNDHFNEQHPNGMGNGQGKGRRSKN